MKPFITSPDLEFIWFLTANTTSPNPKAGFLLINANFALLFLDISPLIWGFGRKIDFHENQLWKKKVEVDFEQNRFSDPKFFFHENRIFPINFDFSKKKNSV